MTKLLALLAALALAFAPLQAVAQFNRSPVMRQHDAKPPQLVARIYWVSGANSGTGGFQKVPLNGVDFDPAGIWDPVNLVLRPTRPGYYQVNLRVRCDVNVNCWNVLAIGRNGAAVQAVGGDAGSAVTAIGGSDIIYVNGTTDTIEMWVYTTLVRAYTAGKFDTYMSISGPLR